MNVRLEHRWEADGYAVWFYDKHPLRVYRLGEFSGTPSWISEVAPEDVESDPSLLIRSDMLAALVQEAGKVIPATHATERHLIDAVAVRDRLLKLVEDGWTA